VRKLLLDNGFADASELKKLEKVSVREHSALPRRGRMWTAKPTLSQILTLAPIPLSSWLRNQLNLSGSIPQSLKKDVDAAVEKAKLSPIPPTEQLYEHIYNDGLGMTIRGLDSQHKIKLV